MKRLLVILIVMSLAVGCSRKPEDLEVWRDAEGGYEKIEAWAKSPEEPMDVRVRAVQILLEERQLHTLTPMMEAVTDPATKKTLVDGAMVTIEEMWKAQDQPKLDETTKAKGGQVAVGDSKTVVAKDAAFYLHPHAEGAAKERIEAILAEWISADQDLRTQLGGTTVGQLLPYTGPKGLESAVGWLKETTRPATVQDSIFQHTEDEKIKEELGKVLLERAEAAHPDVSGELEIALLKNGSSAVVPYLTKAIKDPNVPAKTKDGFMDAIVRAQGERATGIFTDLVGTQEGLLRWVSAQRLIEIRGKAGILVAANALPLETGVYANEDLNEETEIFCNFVSTEMKELNVTTIADVLERGLDSERWPTRMVALRCAEIAKVSELKAKIDGMTKDRTAIAPWDGGKTTLGDLATQASAAL